MHKIKKGIKKKIKGKKGKDKEDDLFDPEQLAKYKEELDKAAAEKAAAAAEAAGGDPDYSPTDEQPSSSHTAAAGGGAEGHEEDDEWKKFKLLTSGIDSVLKKTSGDLDRIKSHSYFQRVPPKSTLIFPPSSSLATSKSGQQNSHHPHHQQAQLQSNAATPQQQQQLKNKRKEGGRWVNVEQPGGPAGATESDGEANEDHKGESVKSPEGDKEAEVEEKEAESPEPVEVDDDLFDTSFVDKVATGDLKLSYVPDSPVVEEADGDDPFDTSGVADVVKKIEEEEKRQKKKVNLGLAVNVLTGKEGETLANNSQTARTKQASGGGVVIGRGDSSKKKRRPRPHHINLLGSFDGTNVVGLTQLSPSDKQASSPPADSLLDTILGSSPPATDVLGDIVVPFSVTDSVGGESSENHNKTDAPAPHSDHKEGGGLNLKELLSEFDVISEESGVDTGKKESINLAKALNEDHADEDDLEDEFAALAVESLHKDNHSRSSSPAPGRPPPPTKKVETPVTPQSPDPFDTTYVDIPEEVPDVNSEVKNDDDDDDFDFNPRAGEPEGVEVTVLSVEQSNLTVQKDLLGGSSSDLTALLTSVDPIQPVSDGLIETEVHDPFDTSVVDGLLPGKAELKLLEEELLQPVEGEEELQLQQPPKLPQILQQQQQPVKPIVDDFDDDDFDPRQGEDPVAQGQQQRPQPTVVVHHPKGPQRPPPPVKVPEIHPLDLDHSLQLDSGSSLDTQKTLTPQIDQQEEEEEEEIDPFDTSSVPADVILPGKLELKLLESELAVTNSNITSGGGVVDSDDFDFDPRKEEKPIDDIHDIFDSGDDFFHGQPLQPTTTNSSLTNQQQQQQQQQQGENFDSINDDPSILREDEADPFDTSSFVKENILPGKAELKLLEKELLTGAEDFQPPSLPKIPIVYKSTIVVQQPQPSQEQQQILTENQQQQQHQLETQQSLHPLEIEDEHEEHSFAPLQPLTQSQLSEALDIDPFDTSIANSIVPGKAELKILEAELGAFDPTTTQRRLSDPDFNPRQNPVYPPNFNLNSISAPLIPQTVLQPQAAAGSGVIDEEEDPFDTSVANTILPGKTELKILEAELL